VLSSAKNFEIASRLQLLFMLCALPKRLSVERFLRFANANEVTKSSGMSVCVALVALPIEELKEKSRLDCSMNEMRLTFPTPVNDTKAKSASAAN
jgi:hypothetical protein